MHKLEPGRILVLGTGYVASAYLRALHYLGMRPRVLSRGWLDYTAQGELDQYLLHDRIQLVINAAGYSGLTIDDCERNKQATYSSLVALPRMIAEVCRVRKVDLLHVSSGCIFNGPGPYNEQDTPNNVGQFYAQCKANAEREIAETEVKAWVFRIRMPFSHFPHPRNLLQKLAGYERILDGLNSVTFLDEFAMRSFHLVQKAAPGIYHAACSVPVQTAQIARMLFDAKIRKTAVYPFPERDFLASGYVRRSTTVLDVRKFERAYGAPFGDPMIALRWCIDNFSIATLPAEVPLCAP